MSLKSLIHDIDLNAKCDLSKYNQDIHSFEGFTETNSLFRNKRVMNWRKRTIADNEIIGNITWSSEGSRFIISNGLTTHSISKTGYEKKEIEEIPDDAVRIDSVFEDGDIIYNKESYGAWSKGNVKWLPEGWVVTRKGTEIKLFHDNQEQGSFTIPEDAANYEMLCSYIAESTQIIIDTDSSSYIGEYSIYSRILEKTINIAFLPSSGKESDRYSYLWNTQLKELCPLNVPYGAALTLYKNGNPVALPQEITNGYNFSFNILDQSTAFPYTVGVSLIPDGNNGVLVYISGTLQQNNVWSSVVKYVHSLDSEVNTYSFNSQATTKLSKSTYSNTLKISYSIILGESSGINIAASSYIMNSVFSNIMSYSIKYGLFALNYIRGVPENIGHEYKKIISLENLVGDIFYSDTEMFWKENDNKFYKLSLKEFDAPQYEIAGNYYLLFNTTEYNNAIFFSNGSLISFCSCDDWNNRFNFVNVNSMTSTPVASRCGNDWAVKGTIQTVSSQYGSEIKRVSDDSDVIWYVDPNYTAPDYTEYTVYWSSDSGSQSGVMIEQGKISTSGFTRKQNEASIWTDPAESNGYQDNPPLLSAKFMSFTNKLYVTVNNFIYQMLNFATRDSMPFLLYLAQETGFNQGDFTQFCINGQIYTYYPGTSQIQDSNDQWVCNTDLMEYVGFSTYAAYFYCTFDHNLYGFTGANTMEKLAPIERETLVHSSYADGKGGTVLMAHTLNIPSLNLVCFDFGNKLGLLNSEQFCLIDMGRPLGNMLVDKEDSSIRIGDTAILLNDVSDSELLPIKIETQFYGNPGNSNSIFDTIYVSISNLNEVEKGKLTIETEVLQNEKAIKSPAKEFVLSSSDFNSYGVAVIKYQPKIQEGRGIKIRLVSDFEIVSLKVGEMTASTESQTKIRG